VSVLGPKKRGLAERKIGVWKSLQIGFRVIINTKTRGASVEKVKLL
jgi:hypothetical protein